MFNGVLEAVLAVFEYRSDEQLIRDVGNFAFSLTKDEWNVLLNNRAYQKNIECLVPDCDRCIWAVNSELLSGYNRDKMTTYTKLLIEYTCGFHENQYEVMSIYERHLSDVL